MQLQHFVRRRRHELWPGSYAIARLRLRRSMQLPRFTWRSVTTTKLSIAPRAWRACTMSSRKTNLQRRLSSCSRPSTWRKEMRELPLTSVKMPSPPSKSWKSPHPRRSPSICVRKHICSVTTMMREVASRTDWAVRATSHRIRRKQCGLRSAQGRFSSSSGISPESWKSWTPWPGRIFAKEKPKKGFVWRRTSWPLPRRPETNRRRPMLCWSLRVLLQATVA
mmetsp:Transcript_32296/g.77153  ORF Transcript_32296/g.77153 Transcript_32296/m.77153 type:complete len:222 (-) Transcript_32296:539-1204(-)